MPIHKVTGPEGGEGWKWGSHGKVYATREEAEKQEQAAYANGYTGDSGVNATGIVCRAPWGGILFLKRADGNFTGHWGLPGGGIDDGETPERAAHRELLEETGYYLSGDMREINRADNGFITHMADVPESFTPQLNSEHSEFVWAFPDNPPAPLHPGVKAMIGSIDPSVWAPVVGAEPETAMDAKPILAMDRDTVRRIDDSGYLHVGVSNISKANICPYFGREIPGWQELGLDKDTIYQLYRDPEELAKAASTFNNLPVLSEHMPINPDDWDSAIPSAIKIGSTGTDAEFDAPYLKNSLVIWSGGAIKNIDSDAQKDISCGYFYTPDMTPVEIDGVKADGTMRRIVGNHVAIVPEGRAGPDVVIGDAKPKPKESETMPNTAKLSRKAVAARGAIAAYLRPKMAADAKISLRPILAGVTSKNFASKKAVIATGVKTAVTGKLAQDADIEDLVELLDTLDCADAETAMDEEDMDDMDMADDLDPMEAAKAFLKGKLSPEDYADFEAKLTAKKPDAPGANDDDLDDKDKITEAAMDARISAALAENDAKHRGIREALTEVKPYVGELAMSFDSGAAVKRHALKMMGVADAGSIHESALSSLLKAQTKPSSRQPAAMAHDAAASASFASAFPGTANIAR